jgi:hypothetical protein
MPSDCSGSRAVPEDPELLEFLRCLQAEVIERASESGLGPDGTASEADFKDNVFTQMFLDDLAEAGVVENADVCYFDRKLGQGQARVNGYAVSEDELTLDLFVTIYRHADGIQTVTREDVERALRQALRYFREAVNGTHVGMERASDAFAMTERIHDIRGRVDRLRLFLLTNGVTTTRDVDIDSDSVTRVEVHIWDVQRLFRTVRSGLPRETIDIDFQQEFGAPLRCLPTPQISSADYVTLLTILPATMLDRLYERYGSRLLELNVRSFLQARGKVNRGIRDTLRSEPFRFLAYNNGLSATAEAVDTLRTADGQLAISVLRGFQVVNGGQTMASIHRAKKDDRADISGVFVQAKITVICGSHLEEMVSKISRFANTQNVVNEADFSANDPFHVAIERLSQTTWNPGEQGRWFYERARGQYQVAKSREATTAAQRRLFEERTPPRRKFTKTDLAKYMNSWAQLPHVVSRGGQKNFLEFALRLRDMGKNWVPDQLYYQDLVGKAILFKRVTKVVAEEGFPAYRANIVTYTIAYAAYRLGGQLELVRIWNHQDISAGLVKLVRAWSHFVNDAITASSAGRNVTEWCKRKECWDIVNSLNLELDPAVLKLVSELTGSVAAAVGGPATNVVTSVDMENIARCKHVAGERWLRIHAWGKRTRVLTSREAGIALTMSSMATGGWQKDPSRKQAWHGVRILNKAEEHGPFGEEDGRQS